MLSRFSTFHGWRRRLERALKGAQDLLEGRPMRITQILCYVLASVLMAVSAQAQTPMLAERVRTAVDNYLVALEDGGLHAIFHEDHPEDIIMNFDDLRAEFRTVAWYEFADGLERPNFTGERRSAFYLREPKEVHVAQSLSRVSDDELALIGLHEGLGALGYDDRNYQISGSLWFLKGEKRPDAINWFRDTIAFVAVKRKDPPSLLVAFGEGGSGTSVGGGGDLTAILVKYRVLRRILIDVGADTSSFLWLLQADFEPDYNGSVVKYGITQDLNVKVTIPDLAWLQMSSAAQNAWIQDINDHVLAVLSSYSGQPMLYFGDCKDIGSISLPQKFAPAAAELRKTFLEVAKNKPGCSTHPAELTWHYRP